MNLSIVVVAAGIFGFAQEQRPLPPASTAAPADQSVQIPSLPSIAVPPYLPFSGVLVDSSGEPIANSAEIVFAIYSEREGGTALWSEVQRVWADQRGQYSV